MRAQIILSRENLIHNITTIRNHIGPNRKIIAVVKAHAYGHGLREVVRVIEEHVSVFAVDDIQELERLRTMTAKDIYMLGSVLREDIEKALLLRGTLVVYDAEMLIYVDQIAQKLGRPAAVNVKIDALLGRQGVLLDKLPALLTVLKNCSHVSLRGVYAHFANIEDTTDFTHAQKQIECFRQACDVIEQHGFSGFERHMSSTAAILLYDHAEPAYTHVRLGIGLYGLWPSESVRARMRGKITLRPVLSWTTYIAQVKTVPKGSPIGYGLTFVTPRAMKIAVVPQGYSDGYDRRLSNCGEVLIGGKRCRVLGRVAMNMFAVDVSEIADVRVEDEVVLIGKQGNEEIAAEEIAEKTETINYEVVARINPLLARMVE